MDLQTKNTSPVAWAGLLIAVLALAVALTGAGYAAFVVTGKDVKNGSLAGKDIKNSSVTGKDIKDDALTGADVAESSLGTVPNASALGGATLGQLTLGRSAGTDSCTIGLSYIDCSATTIVLPRPQRLLVVASAEVGVGTSANANAYATCRVEVDDVATGKPSQVGWGGTSFAAGSVFPQFAAAVNTVTAPLAAGAHTVAIACVKSLGTALTVIHSEVAAVAISGD